MPWKMMRTAHFVHGVQHVLQFRDRLQAGFARLACDRVTFGRETHGVGRVMALEPEAAAVSDVALLRQRPSFSDNDIAGGVVPEVLG